MNNSDEKKRLRGFLAWCGGIMTVSLYLGLHLGHATCGNINPDGEINWAAAISQFAGEILKPLKIFPSNMQVLMWVMAIGALVCLYEYGQFVRKAKTMPGREHGSAAFNTDYANLRREYIMSPGILIDRELDRKGILDVKERKEKRREMEHAGKYAIDRKERRDTGRKVCRARHFDRDDVAYCLMHAQLYSRNVALSMDTSMTQLNLNTIVFGGSGTGKSRFFVKPNLLQANSSYVVTDPSGELMMSCGKFLSEQGYVIKCFNIEDMTRSNRYNPFAYVREDADIPVMVEALIDNIEGPKKGGSGDSKFWDETSRTLLIAVCGYLFETQPMERRNFNNVLRLLNMADVSDEREVEEDDLDLLFRDLEEANPESYAVSQYRVIKQAGTGKTAQNIIISTTAIFARFFRLDRIANLTYRDELHLEEIGQKKCALFIVTPQGDTTYNFLASLLYTQLFATLYRQGEENSRQTNSASVRLAVPVRCLIDEAANIGVIPHFAERLATMRKYGISCCPIYQNQAQVKALFKDNWETIVGNSDTMLFLGGIDASTVKMVSERLGKGTITTMSENMQRGRRGSSSEGMNSAGRELMTTTEIEQMDNTQCITFIRSMKPFRDFKYPYERHPNFQYTGDADPSNNYFGNFVLDYDREVMRSIAVRRVSDPGYVKPGAGGSEETSLGDGAPAEVSQSNRTTVSGRTSRRTEDEDGADRAFAWAEQQDCYSEVRMVHMPLKQDKKQRVPAPVPLSDAVRPGEKVRPSEVSSEEMVCYEDDFDEILRRNLQETAMGRMLLQME